MRDCATELGKQWESDGQEEVKGAGDENTGCMLTVNGPARTIHVFCSVSLDDREEDVMLNIYQCP